MSRPGDPLQGASALIDALAHKVSFPAAPIHCAVSGGADSLALLALATHAVGPANVTVWHIDHRLRSTSSDEARRVAQVASLLGVTCEVRAVDVGDGPNLEARARVARYAALPDSVCTGHTADDVAESVVMNLMRGAGFDGMSPMQRAGAPRPGQSVSRPLLQLRRTETVDLCRSLGWDPVVDQMNADPRFLRSRVRHELLPWLAEIAGRDVVSVIARSAEAAAQDVAILEALADEVDPTDARAVSVAPPALARRALRKWFLEAGIDPDGHPPTLAVLDRAMAVARGDAVACEVGFGWRLRRSRQRLALTSDARKGSPGGVNAQG
jgi:tRNA(Ile)-lysidine synthase